VDQRSSYASKTTSDQYWPLLHDHCWTIIYQLDSFKAYLDQFPSSPSYSNYPQEHEITDKAQNDRNDQNDVIENE